MLIAATGMLLSLAGLWAARQHNARLARRSRVELCKLMSELNLPRPKLIDVAVPANQNLGLSHGA